MDLGEGGQEGGSDTIYLSSECPSFLSLDDKAYLESCKGANVHLDDCGLYTDNGSYFKIGGSKDEFVIYVKVVMMSRNNTWYLVRNLLEILVIHSLNWEVRYGFDRNTNLQKSRASISEPSNQNWWILLNNKKARFVIY